MVQRLGGRGIDPGYYFRAQLFGGLASGLMIQLPRLDDRIAVYRDGGPLFAVGVESASPPAEAAEFFGIYERVGTSGPEPPVYIPAA